MAKKAGSHIDPQAILYGPPLPRRASRARTKQPWCNHLLRPSIAEHDYVVVEEVIDDYVSIVVAPWPTVDSEGRLRFGPESKRHHAIVDRASLQRRLAKREVLAYDRSKEETMSMQRRGVADGDVFAIETRLPKGESDLREYGSRWIRGKIIDVTAMARDASKATMLAALTGTPLSTSEVEKISEPPPEPESPQDPSNAR